MTATKPPAEEPEDGSTLQWVSFILGFSTLLSTQGLYPDFALPSATLRGAFQAIKLSQLTLLCAASHHATDRSSARVACTLLVAVMFLPFGIFELEQELVPASTQGVYGSMYEFFRLLLDMPRRTVLVTPGVKFIYFMVLTFTLIACFFIYMPLTLPAPLAPTESPVTSTSLFEEYAYFLGALVCLAWPRELFPSYVVDHRPAHWIICYLQLALLCAISHRRANLRFSIALFMVTSVAPLYIFDFEPTTRVVQRTGSWGQLFKALRFLFGSKYFPHKTIIQQTTADADTVVATVALASVAAILGWWARSESAPTDDDSDEVPIAAALS